LLHHLGHLRNRHRFAHRMATTSAADTRAGLADPGQAGGCCRAWGHSGPPRAGYLSYGTNEFHAVYQRHQWRHLQLGSQESGSGEPAPILAGPSGMGRAPLPKRFAGPSASDPCCSGLLSQGVQRLLAPTTPFRLATEGLTWQPDWPDLARQRQGPRHWPPPCGSRSLGAGASGRGVAQAVRGQREGAVSALDAIPSHLPPTASTLVRAGFSIGSGDLAIRRRRLWPLGLGCPGSGAIASGATGAGA